jgi:hypothetical protein
MWQLYCNCLIEERQIGDEGNVDTHTPFPTGGP